MSLQSSHLSLLSREQLEGSSPLSPARNRDGSVASGSSVSLSSIGGGNGHVAAATAAATAGCPYAAAMARNNNNDAPPPSSSSLPPSLPGLIELRGCPAFANQQCPFRAARSQDEISHTLAQVPPSHLQSGGVFMQTLAFYHKGAAGGPVASGTSGGCPVKALLPKDFSFDRALEDFSLAAIMGKLAKEHELSAEGGNGIATSGDASVVSSDAGSEDWDGDARGFLSEVESIVSIDDETEMTFESTVPASPHGSTSLESQEQDHSAKETNLGAPSSSAGGQLRLSDALKSGTAQAHEAAESVHFVKNFIRGVIDRDLYGLLVAQLFHVYGSLEAALEEHAPTHFAPCHFPTELNRTASLQEDVDFWHAKSTPPVSAATQDYLDRIDHLTKEDPLLLLAHAYTRYLGDLSGGKILARVAKRALQLEKDGEGLAFYHFDHISSFKRFKDRYRASLNELPLDDVQIHALVREANVAFLLNMRLFEELDVLGGVPNATVRSLDDVYTIAQEAASNMTAKAPQGTAPCPFANVGAAADGHSKAVHAGGRTCPWPFILLHDPKAGMRRWQTWLVIGLFLAGCYQQVAFNEAMSNAVAVDFSEAMSNAVAVGADLYGNAVAAVGTNLYGTYAPPKTKAELQRKKNSSAKAFRRAISYSQIYQVWKDDTDSLP